MYIKNVKEVIDKLLYGNYERVFLEFSDGNDPQYASDMRQYLDEIDSERIVGILPDDHDTLRMRIR